MTFSPRLYALHRTPLPKGQRYRFTCPDWLHSPVLRTGDIVEGTGEAHGFDHRVRVISGPHAGRFITVWRDGLTPITEDET